MIIFIFETLKEQLFLKMSLLDLNKEVKTKQSEHVSSFIFNCCLSLVLGMEMHFVKVSSIKMMVIQYERHKLHLMYTYMFICTCVRMSAYANTS